MAALQTPLHPHHLAAGTAMVEFAGWEMPLLFRGIVEEHLAVRHHAGAFDVSHMGKVLVEGDGAWEFLMRLSTNDVPKTRGRSRYTHMLDEDGRILDDVIVTCLDADRYFVVCNAAPRDHVIAWLGAHAGPVTMRDVTLDHLCLAVQGPKAARIMQMLTSVDLNGIKPFRGAFVDLLLSERIGTVRDPGAAPETEGWGPLAPDGTGDGCLITRTGYTGEDGFELYPSRNIGLLLWRALLAAGRDSGLQPAGLGARDTLRLEKGYLLSGTDFDGRQTSLETSSEGFVRWDHEFIGRDALQRQKEHGDYDRLVGLVVEGRGIPRHGHKVLQDRDVVGTVTSGTMSPVLRTGIALAYVRPEVAAPDTELAIDVRGRPVRAVVRKPPFV